MADVVVVTVAAEMAKAAEVLPAGTLTLAGTPAAAVLESATVAPPAGAAPLSRTVPVADPPLVTVVGLMVKPVSETAGAGGLTVRLAVRLVPPRVAFIVADVVAVTVPAVIPNVAELFPVATVTLAGTAAGAVLESATVAPPAGAAPLSVTVPVATPPLATEAGAMVRPVNDTGCGLTVRVNERSTPPYEPVNVA